MRSNFMDLPFRETFSGQPQCLQKATNSIQHIPQSHRVETTPANPFLCLLLVPMDEENDGLLSQAEAGR